jgi:CRP-like cAMP-binding protein
MDIIFLKKVVLFKELTNEELKIFAGKMKHIKYTQGESIITENEESDKLFILHSGKVRISKKMTMVDEEEERNKTFVVLSASDFPFFGEIGLLGLRKRTANAIAKTDCELYTINQKDFMQICNKNPGIGFKVLLEISRKLSSLLEKTNEDILKLTTALIYALR